MADRNLSQSAYCHMCSQAFHPESLFYGCADGHFFCKKCYKEDHRATPSLVCLYKRCKSALFEIDNRSGEPSVKLVKNKTKMFPEAFQISKEKSKEVMLKRSKSSILQGSHSNCSIGSLSKKPLNCPHAGCEKSIGVASVGYHFKIEHTRVTRIHSSLEKRHSLQLQPYTIEHNHKLSISLLKMNEERTKDEEYPSCSRCYKDVGKGDTDIRPVMLVLGARISNYQLAGIYKEFSDSDDSDGDYGHEFAPELDKIILWIACNIPTKCKYTIAVSTLCQTIRLKYYGYVAQMSDDCSKLCEQGKGLILNYSQIVGMTNRNKQPVNLDFIIHEEDLFCCSYFVNLQIFKLSKLLLEV